MVVVQLLKAQGSVLQQLQALKHLLITLITHVPAAGDATQGAKITELLDLHSTAAACTNKTTCA